jgi:hypothetical protein
MGIFLNFLTHHYFGRRTWRWRPRYDRHEHHEHDLHLALRVNKRIYVLNPERRTIIMEQLTVGHTDTMSILYVDTAGNPMLTPVTPDSPPTWVDTPATPPVDTFTVSADGTTAVLAATAAGTDTVNLTVVVGGKTYTVSAQFAISAPPQVLGGVQIVHNIV